MEQAFGPISNDYLYVELGISNKRTFLHDLKLHLRDGFRCVIIDPIIDSITVQNTNEYRAVHDAVKPLVRLAAEFGAHRPVGNLHL